jgi:hypothetical protein
MEVILVLDNLKVEKPNGLIEKYHVAISSQAIYLINSSNDYSKIVASIFYGIADIATLFESTLGFVGGLISVTTGEGLSKMLSDFAKSSSDKKINKVLANLDKHTGEASGITKLSFEKLQKITYKKGYFINGKSFIEFASSQKKYKLVPENRRQIDALKKVIKDHGLNASVEYKIF